MSKRKIIQSFLDVGQGHKLHYKTYGNPEGIPILFLHGGPGYSFTKKDEIFFDQEAFFVIFFDQRACGKSLPKGLLAHNTTEALVSDIKKLLELFDISKCVLFGGSWGASLALIFAIKYPEFVQHIILRGFFPANHECRHFFEEGGSAAIYPEAWKRYSQMVPTSHHGNIPAFYYKKMEDDDRELAAKYAFESQVYGMSIDGSQKSMEEIEAAILQTDFITKAKIQCYYSANYFFIPDDYIFTNASRISKISVDIIHGIHDKICDVKFARRLHGLLPESTLQIVDAAHSPFEPLITEALINALHKLVLK